MTILSVANKPPVFPVLINGVLNRSVEVFDRGFMYGDGLFETIRVVKGDPFLWDYHTNRLVEGCKKLSLPVDSDLILRLRLGLERVVKEAGRHAETCIVKIVISRGVGGRGYQVPDKVQLTEVIICYPAPDYPLTYSLEGIELRTCHHRLSENPSLSGIKHLNRLDQVLASRELQEFEAQRAESEAPALEGLMLDQSGQVIECTKSNILLFEQGGIVSPDTRLCGVDGVAKNYIFDCAKKLGLSTRIDNVLPSSIPEFEGMAITNSVLGIWPVCRLDGVKLPISPLVYEIQRLLNEKLMYEYQV